MDTHALLPKVKTIAIVGLSNKPDRYSYTVGKYLQTQGFKIIPINPNIKKTLGETSYPDITSVPKDIKIDLVDIFRKSTQVMPSVKEAVKRGDIKTIWMQEGITNPQAEKYAQVHGLHVVTNFCLMKAHQYSI